MIRTKEPKSGFAPRYQDKCDYLVVGESYMDFFPDIPQRQKVLRDKFYHTPGDLHFVGLVEGQSIVYYKAYMVQKGVYRIDKRERVETAAEENLSYTDWLNIFWGRRKKSAEKRWRVAPYTRHDWLLKYVGTPAKEILEFCQKHDILNELKGATDLAEKCFWSSDLKLEKEADPETGDTQIVITLSIKNKSREEVLAAYRAFRERSIEIVPWPKSGLIRLSYDIV